MGYTTYHKEDDDGCNQHPGCAGVSVAQVRVGTVTRTLCKEHLLFLNSQVGYSECALTYWNVQLSYE